jgi:hypothetical protein
MVDNNILFLILVSDVWMPLDPLVFGSFQFTITELESSLLDLDDGKGPGLDGVFLF